MQFAEYGRATPVAFAALLALGLAGVSGCGVPGAPQPPSLKLPEPVRDLVAVRAGDSIALTWTMPRKSTDRLLLTGQIPAEICWKSERGPCQPLAQAAFAPEVKAELTVPLPQSLLAGDPRPVSVYVELKSPKGRSAGLSNPVEMLAGAAPPPIAGLNAQVRADGVALRWAPDPSGAALVRLHRKLLTPAAAKPKQEAQGISLQPAAEPLLRDLLVEAPAGGVSHSALDDALEGALDGTARFGQVYEYTAQRVLRVSVPVSASGAAGGQAGRQVLELPGAISAPVRVETVDTFPPAVPRGLAAVFDSEQRTVDLSWEPDSEEDLAGYIVYRADSQGPWRRISGPQPLAGAAYRDTTAETGHTYRYAVAAIDRLGHESQRSAEALEVIPNP